MAASSSDGGGEGASGVRTAITPLSLPPPRPKSPPEYPDLYGKRREAARVQMLEREIGFLEGEIKFIEGVQPASRCCKEVSDFVVANSDPLIPAQRKSRRHCRFLRWLCSSIPCLSLVSFCCCCQSECSCHLKKPKCCNCPTCCDGSCCSNSCCCPKPSCPSCPSCSSCSCFRGCCCSCPDMSCCIPTCFRSCACSKPSCLSKKKKRSCCSCNWKMRWSSCFRCPKLRFNCCCFCNCKNLCSNPCCLAF